MNKFGGYGIRAKEEAEAQKLISDAIALDEAGCFAIVLEKVPAKLAAEVSKKVKAVTIESVQVTAATDRFWFMLMHSE